MCETERVIEQCTLTALRQNILLSNREQPTRGDSPNWLLGWVYYLIMNNLGMYKIIKYCLQTVFQINRFKRHSSYLHQEMWMKYEDN